MKANLSRWIESLLMRSPMVRELKHRAVIHEESVRSLAAERTEALDEVRDLRARVSQLEADLSASRLETIKASQMTADWIARQMFGRPIFGTGPEIPSGEVATDPIRRSRTQARVTQQQQEQEFLRQCEARARSVMEAERAAEATRND